MQQTISHNDAGKAVAAAKLLTGYRAVKEKLKSPNAWLMENERFDAGFVSHMLIWQKNHGLKSDGIIGPKTWTAIAKNAPTVSTAKKPTGSYTLALQLLLDSSITADAMFGPRTRNAVAAYQTAAGLDADGVCGPVTWAGIITGEVKKPAEDASTPAGKGKFTKPKDYKQYDSRWGSKMYSNHNDKSQTMRNSACGPTSMADIVYTLKDKSIDPYDLAKLSMQWGTRTYSSGTSWDFFTKIQKHFSFKKMIATKSLETLKACLDAGGYAVCSMAPGYWTKGGHFICAWKYDATYIYCNDPASSTRKKQKLTDFVKQRKQFFCFLS